MNRIKAFRKNFSIILLVLVFLFAFVSNARAEDLGKDLAVTKTTLEDIPAYSGEPYVVLKDNVPDFPNIDKNTKSFEYYSDLDKLGRCQSAVANIGRDLMPTEKRGPIGMVKPTGWHNVKYDGIDGKYLYNRCHLIGYQLTAENANEKNLITGTRYLNVDGMLPFENMVTDYIKETNNHVLYRVTPIFEGDNLVAKGVEMEGYSLEDEGKGISYHVFVYNVQPGISINYGSGDSSLENSIADNNKNINNGNTNSQPVAVSENKIYGNRKSKIYHVPGQRDYVKMETSKNLVVFDTEDAAIAAGYRKAKR